MNPTGWQSRRLVPRWRSLFDTLNSGELASSRNAGPRKDAHPDYLIRLERWCLDPNLITAAELVEGAIVSGREKDGIVAAQRLLADDSTAAPLIKAQAASLLMRAGLEGEIPEIFRRVRQTADAGKWRQFCRLNPRDALSWVELAFAQTLKSHTNAADRSMTVALNLSPTNRHVVRSAARLFLHIGEKERAHDLLLTCPATRNDPWLLAAELSLAEVAERSPRFVKPAHNTLQDGGFPPHQLTELAGAAATLELVDGSRKKAKRLFIQSMIDPTGNALAQAEWATPTLGSEVIATSRFSSIIEPFEAKSFHLYRERQFSKVPEACEQWAEVDQFSVRPYEFGSAAAGHAGLFDRAAELALSGLERRPNSPLLLNCRAYALASLGKVTEASVELAKVKVDVDDKKLGFLTMANWGLVEFRRGNLDSGLSFYREAIEGFTRSGNRVSSAHARVYLAREAVNANLPEAKKLVVEAQVAMKSFPTSEAAGVLRNIEISIGFKPREIPNHVTPPEVDGVGKPISLLPQEIKWVTPGWPPLTRHNL